MATTMGKAPGGLAAESFIRERFGLAWGPDVLGIAHEGVTAESVSGETGLLKIELVARCTREDVERFVSLLWAKPEPTP